MTDDSAEILFQSFSSGCPCEQFWHGQNCSLFDVVHPSFSLPTTALPTLQGALKDGFGEALVVQHASFRLLTIARRDSCGLAGS